MAKVGIVVVFEKQELPGLSCGVSGPKSRFDNFGVIQDDHVARLNIIDKILISSVFYSSGVAVKDQKSAGSADFWRVLGDKLFREFVGVIR